MRNRGVVAVQRVEAWTDSKGQMHPSKDKAIAAEMSIALGGVGAADGLAPGLVRLLLESREAILPLLTEYGAPEARNELADESHRSEGQGDDQSC